MLVKGIKLKVLTILFFFLCSCSNKTELDTYVDDNFKNYSILHELIKDSVEYYVKSNLSDFIGEYFWKWQVDSLVCVNSANDKLVTTINISSGISREAVSDEILKLLGIKKNNKWYFFHGGGALIVPRDMYKKTEMEPLSFHELSQIARKEFMNGSIKKGIGSAYVTDDRWINSHFEYNGICGHCRTKKQFDSTYWELIKDKWNHRIDTTKLKQKTENYPANLNL